MDVSEYLWSIREEPRFSTDFKSAPPGGKVAYHAPCHLRAQGVGFKGRDLAAMDIVDGFGQRSRLDFSAVQANVAVPAERFQFKLPAGADLIEQ